jgi:hypothetical protein
MKNLADYLLCYFSLLFLTKSKTLNFHLSLINKSKSGFYLILSKNLRDDTIKIYNGK